MTGSQGFPIPDKHYRSSICCWSCSCCFDVGHWYSEETKDFWSAGRHLWFVLRTLGYSSFGSALKFGSLFFSACGHPTSGYCPYYGQSFHQHEPWEGCSVIYTYHQGYGTFLFCCSFCNFPWRGNFLSLYKFCASYCTGFEPWNLFLYWMAWQLPTVWVGLSLLPIVGGVALASLTEASFNWYVTITIIWIQVYLNLTTEDKSFCQMPYVFFVSLTHCVSLLYYICWCVWT